MRPPCSCPARPFGNSDVPLRQADKLPVVYLPAELRHPRIALLLVFLLRCLVPQQPCTLPAAPQKYAGHPGERSVHLRNKGIVSYAVTALVCHTPGGFDKDPHQTPWWRRLQPVDVVLHQLAIEGPDLAQHGCLVPLQLPNVDLLAGILYAPGDVLDGKKVSFWKFSLCFFLCSLFFCHFDCW